MIVECSTGPHLPRSLRRTQADGGRPPDLDFRRFRRLPQWRRHCHARDRRHGDPSIHTIVVGMHEALPDSISKGHSMSESAQGEVSGRSVYLQLLGAQNNAHKNVYVLASHSHFFMDGVHNTEYWRSHGGVLPGWIVGTAGAVRYALPPAAGDARIAKTNVYGYLLGTVSPGGAIEFRFQQIDEEDVPAAVVAKFGQTLVHDCFAANRQ